MEELSDKQLEGLARLLVPFRDSEISDLPKPTAKQTQEVKADYKKGIRCKLCGGWHHKDVVHLKYVGHAALTKRLLEADPMWNWEPVAVNEDGTPKFDSDGGMWGKLTVCGVTRLGYGDAQGKHGPNATKEIIGDFCRNAAMRFGAALDLWSKADLTIDDDPPKNPPEKKPAPKVEYDKTLYPRIKNYIEGFKVELETGGYYTAQELQTKWDESVEGRLPVMSDQERKDINKVMNDTLDFLISKE